MLGGVLLRVNGFLIGYDTGLGVDHGWNYFPSIAEMLVTMGMFALEVLGYIIITRRFPCCRAAQRHTESRDRRTT
jgi:Ni/Fe-hydrogenase subunit HybB-like protein